MSYNATHGGKGDCPRPVDSEKYRTNYDLIFRKNEHETKHSDPDDSEQNRQLAKTQDKKASHDLK